MKEPKEHFGNTILGDSIGIAIIIFAICIGIGGCVHLSQ